MSGISKTNTKAKDHPNNMSPFTHCPLGLTCKVSKSGRVQRKGNKATTEALLPQKGEQEARHTRSIWVRHKRRTFLAFCVRTKMTLYDVTSQVHSWLLSFLSVEKQDTFPAGYENEANNWLPFSTNQRRASTTTNRGAREGTCELRPGLSLLRKFP